MPFLQKITLPNATIFFWKITENESELLSEDILSPIDNQRFKNIKAVKQQLCFLAVRRLLQHIGIPKENLSYNKNGKPFLSDNKHISISHSYPYAMIGIGNVKIGIDIENQRNTIEKVAYRFTNWQTTEKSSTTEKISALTQLWTIKEALYKVANTIGVDFKKQLLVENFSAKEQHFSAFVKYDTHLERYDVFCGMIDTFAWSAVLLSDNQKITTNSEFA